MIKPSSLQHSTCAKLSACKYGIFCTVAIVIKRWTTLYCTCIHLIDIQKSKNCIIIWNYLFEKEGAKKRCSIHARLGLNSENLQGLNSTKLSAIICWLLIQTVQNSFSLIKSIKIIMVNRGKKCLPHSTCSCNIYVLLGLLHSFLWFGGQLPTSLPLPFQTWLILTVPSIWLSSL